MPERRIYTLSSDAQHNYLMEYNTAGVMEQPGFLRAGDTKGKEVFTPEFIETIYSRFFKDF